MNKKQPPSAHHNQPGEVPRVFIGDLHGLEFQEFHQYRRAFQQQPSETPQPAKRPRPSRNVRKRDKKLDDAISAIVKKFSSKTRRSQNIRAGRQEASIKGVNRLLSVFDLRAAEHRPELKTHLAGILTRYLIELSMPWTPDLNDVWVPIGYTLEGSPVGGDRKIDFVQEFEQLLNEAILWNLRTTLGLLWELIQQGHPDSLQYLAKAIVPFVKALNEQAIKNPLLLGDWPQRLPFWPVLKSQHHSFNSDHQELLRLLRVGEQFPLPIVHEARWNARDTIGKWALHLCHEIEILQASDYNGEDFATDAEPAEWAKEIGTLPPFAPETWDRWWIVAHGLLLHEYIDVVEIPELNRTVSSRSDRKTPGRIRKRILQALKDKFKSWGRENKTRVSHQR